MRMVVEGGGGGSPGEVSRRQVGDTAASQKLVLSSLRALDMGSAGIVEHVVLGMGSAPWSISAGSIIYQSSPPIAATSPLSSVREGEEGEAVA